MNIHKEHTPHQLATVYQLSRIGLKLNKLTAEEKIDLIAQLKCICETHKVDLDSLIEADAKTILVEVSKMIKVPPLSLESSFVNPRLH